MSAPLYVLLARLGNLLHTTELSIQAGDLDRAHKAVRAAMDLLDVIREA